jgi:hypothetical protein
MNPRFETTFTKAVLRVSSSEIPSEEIFSWTYFTNLFFKDPLKVTSGGCILERSNPSSGPVSIYGPMRFPRRSDSGKSRVGPVSKKSIVFFVQLAFTKLKSFL